MQYSQKNSPYIEEVSRHLDFLVEIGMFEKWKADVLENATMCNTLRKKLDSKQETLTVLSLSHVGTTFALAFIGLMAAAISFCSEFGWKKCFGTRTITRNKTFPSPKVDQIHNALEESASSRVRPNGPMAAWPDSFQ